VTEIISTGANDVYVVVGPEGELLLPAIESVILEIDLDADQMVVHMMEGLR
jgi:16S rRNA processing protein RimM